MKTTKEPYQSPDSTWLDLVPGPSLCQMSGNVDGVNEEEWGTF